MKRLGVIAVLVAVLLAFGMARASATGPELTVGSDSLSWSTPGTSVNPVVITLCYHTEGFYKPCLNSGFQIGDGYAMDFSPTTNSASLWSQSSNNVCVGSPTSNRCYVRIEGPYSQSPFTGSSPSPACKKIVLRGTDASGTPAIFANTNADIPQYDCPDSSGLNIGRNSSDALGFYGKSPVTQQAAPATLAEVVAVLQALGLVAD